MTNPTSGTAALEEGGSVSEGRQNPKILGSGFCGPWNCFTSSSAQLRMDSQVSYRVRIINIVLVSNTGNVG